MQVLMDEEDFQEIQRIARTNKMSVAEWVRQTLRAARQKAPTGRMERKLDVVREASMHQFPVVDIGQMLSEIEGGYLEGRDHEAKD